MKKTAYGMPLMGLGTFGRTGREGMEAILAALEIGYRHIDTAQTYNTEGECGEAFRHSGLGRDEVFFTTKISTENFGPGQLVPSLRRSLDTLGLEQVDLTLLHWPSPHGKVPLTVYAEQIAEAQSLGLTRQIGVSNFTIALLGELQALLGGREIVNNQVECHPYLQNESLVRYCRAHDISVTCYLPIARGKLGGDRVLEPLALRTQRRTALYSVFEYRPFETLSHRIKRKQTLPLAEALELGAHLLAGLEALHGQGVVHGALRARALFFDRRARRLWLLGLGQAGAGTGDYGSDASYGAPEVLAGERVSERSDIYAAGVVIYHMLTGRYPYGRIRSGEDWKVSRTYRTLESQEVAAPPGLDEALERACARDPARRFASVAQFAAALDAVRVQQPAPAEPARRNERWGVWAAALLAAALAVYLYVTFG